MRVLFVLVSGVVLGLLVHLVIVLAIPRVAERDGWSRAMALAAEEGVTLIPAARPGNEALPLLDPALAHAVCRIDLARGPVLISAPLPREFWSISLHSHEHGAYYAVTQDAASAGVFDVEIRNAVQMRRFRMEETEPDPETLYLEAPADINLVVFRALSGGRSGRAEVEAHLADITCGPAPQRLSPERPTPFPLPRSRPSDLS
jgi:uncharacterized membrane protein